MSDEIAIPQRIAALRQAFTFDLPTAVRYELWRLNLIVQHLRVDGMKGLHPDREVTLSMPAYALRVLKFADAQRAVLAMITVVAPASVLTLAACGDPDPTPTTQLYQASRRRLLPQAQDTALSAGNGNRKLDYLSKAFQDAGLDRRAQHQLVREAWEAAVESILNSRPLLTQDEEDSLKRYMNHFGLAPDQLNGKVPYRTLVYSSILRGITEEILPPKQEVDFFIPFNLMKSETLVWVMRDVEYHKTVTRRERQGTSDWISTSMDRGIYNRPGTFRSRTIEWDEPVHADTGFLGFTTKHIYFAGKKEMFRVRYDKIVGFEYYGDGFGIMRDNLTAKPQAFRTGEWEGWFAHNLTFYLAKMY